MYDRKYGEAPGHCQDRGDGTSQVSQCSDIDGLVMRMYSGSSRCDGAFETRWNRVHTCFNTFPHSSEAYVCHNTSFTEIAPPLPGKPIPAEGTLKVGFQCATASTCPPHTPYLTFWSNNHCQGSPVSSKVIYGNLLIDHCYYSDSLMNVKATCSNDGILRITSYQSGCDGDAYFYEEVPTDVCIPHPSGGSHKAYCGRN